MVSRRRILSRSRDELSTDLNNMDDEEDVWFQKDRLFKDHIQEVLQKWGQIDDEIWAKIICMERNRRVAKAYARAPVLTINGSDDGFDGYRIGMCGFDNPMRDAKTEEVKRHIGHGVKIKMDDGGNIMIKRISKSNVFVKEAKGQEDNCSVSAEVIRLGGQLEGEKPVKLFDMKKFQQNVNRELRKAYPERRKLESQCISAVSFVKDAPDLLDCPCWIMVINVVALDMLKSKLPPALSKRPSPVHVSTVFDSSRLQMADEDPYSLPAPTETFSLTRSSRSGRDPKPPKLPPRDFHTVPVPLPDYDCSKEDEKPSRKKHPGYPPDDPYYCGLKARVPNFVKRSQEREHTHVRKSHSAGYLSLLRHNSVPLDSSRGKFGDGLASSIEEDYARIYGRLRPPPTHQYSRREVYVGEWE